MIHSLTKMHSVYFHAILRFFFSLTFHIELCPRFSLVAGANESLEPIDPLDFGAIVAAVFGMRSVSTFLILRYLT